MNDGFDFDDASLSFAPRRRRSALLGDAMGMLATTLSLLLHVVGGADAAESVAAPAGPVAVTVTAKGCEPMELTVPAGQVAFVITNRSSRALEWEILDGVIVVDERENIAPGFKSKLTTRLKPGTYEITCGLLDNPRGRLVVVGGDTAAAAPTAADLVGAVAEYRVGTHAALSDLADAVARTARAAGDPAALRAAAVDAETAFLASAPIHDLVGPSATALAADFAELDRLLFIDPPGDAAAVLARLAADADAFAAAAKPIVAPPDRLVAGALATAGEIRRLLEAATPPSPGLLAEVSARRAAVERVVGLFASHAEPAGREPVAALRAALETLQREIARDPGPIGGFSDARTLSPERRAALAAAAGRLVETLAPLPRLLGL